MGKQNGHFTNRMIFILPIVVFLIVICMPVSVDGKNVSDIFSNDTSLNTQLWTMNRPVLQNTDFILGRKFR